MKIVRVDNFTNILHMLHIRKSINLFTNKFSVSFQI